MSEQPRIEDATIYQTISEMSTNVPRELAENCTDSQIEIFLRS